MLRARMGIRAHPTLTKRKTSKGPNWHPVLRLRRADRSSISSFHLADLGGEAGRYLNLHFPLFIGGSGETIPSEPSSLACPIQDWRARVAEREGVNSLGEPERAGVMGHWMRSLVGSGGRGQGRPRRCVRVCWRVRWRANCDVPSAWKPARSRATRCALPRRVVAGERRGRPGRRGCADTCCRALRS